jgi:SAM-dependent methyltransferase
MIGRVRRLKTELALRWQYRKEFSRFRALSEALPGRLSVRWEDRYPCVHDKTGDTAFDRHYVYHTAWAARVLATTRPVRHVDISSDIRFVTIASAFVPIHFYDFRPARLHLSNLVSGQADLTALPFEDGSLASLSCMHVVEHVGLGRYGDSLDPDGDRKAISELKRVVSPNGDLLFVVPVGKPKVAFNAHRIYSYQQIRDYFGDFSLHACCLIPDEPSQGGLVQDPSAALVDRQSYGCGCFWFRRGVRAS